MSNHCVLMSIRGFVMQTPCCNCQCPHWIPSIKAQKLFVIVIHSPMYVHLVLMIVI